MSASSLTGRTRVAIASRVMIYGCLALFALFFIAPVVIMTLTSFRSLDELTRGSIIAWPSTWTVAPWLRAWSEACIGTDCAGIRPYFMNSLLVVIPSVVISTALGALNGFALTKVRFKGADTIFTLMWIGCFIPYQTTLIPAAQVVGWLGLSGSFLSLILVYTIYGIPFTTLFFRNYYVNIPDELIKSATIDGAGFYATLWHILLPISVPIVVVSCIFQFTGIWNEFLFGVSFSSGDTQTVTVALNNLVNTTFGTKEYNVDMAATLIVSLPTLLVYLFAGKYFLRGLTAGAVKG